MLQIIDAENAAYVDQKGNKQTRRGGWTIVKMIVPHGPEHLYMPMQGRWFLIRNDPLMVDLK